MSEPKRWIDEGPPVAVERLLRAAAAERPTEQARARTLTAIGVGLGAGGAAATAGAATAGAAVGAKATGLVATSVLVKWGAAGAFLAAGVVAGKVTLDRAPGGAAHGVPTAAAPSTAAAAPGAVEARPLEHASVPAAPEPATSVVSAAPLANSAVKQRRAVASPRAGDAPPEDAEHLAQEVALVDRARGALARGDAARALAALDDYEARFTRRKFAPEALYLRMEALLRAGHSDAARGVAEKLAKSYPTSPHAARARQVLGGTIP